MLICIALFILYVEGHTAELVYMYIIYKNIYILFFYSCVHYNNIYCLGMSALRAPAERGHQDVDDEITAGLEQDEVKEDLKCERNQYKTQWIVVGCRKESGNTLRLPSCCIDLNGSPALPADIDYIIHG